MFYTHYSIYINMISYGIPMYYSMFYSHYSMAAVSPMLSSCKVEEAAQHATDATYQPNLVVTLINHVSCYPVQL